MKLIAMLGIWFQLLYADVTESWMLVFQMDTSDLTKYMPPKHF